MQTINNHKVMHISNSIQGQHKVKVEGQLHWWGHIFTGSSEVVEESGWNCVIVSLKIRKDKAQQSEIFFWHYIPSGQGKDKVKVTIWWRLVVTSILTHL